MLETDLKSIENNLEKDMAAVKTTADLDQVFYRYLGSQGQIKQLFKGMKGLPEDKRKKIGVNINRLQKKIINLIDSKSISFSSLRCPPACQMNKARTRDNPRSPKLTTEIPITAPAGKAIERALLKLFEAACAVLVLALVAICIPIYPAQIEHNAPIMKAKAVFLAIKKNRITAKIRTKIEIHLYSLCKKAIAPS